MHSETKNAYDSLYCDTLVMWWSGTKAAASMPVFEGQIQRPRNSAKHYNSSLLPYSQSINSMNQKSKKQSRSEPFKTSQRLHK